MSAGLTMIFLVGILCATMLGMLALGYAGFIWIPAVALFFLNVSESCDCEDEDA